MTESKPHFDHFDHDHRDQIFPDCTFAHLHNFDSMYFRCKTMLSITISHRINYYRHFSPDFLFDFEYFYYFCNKYHPIIVNDACNSKTPGCRVEMRF